MANQSLVAETKALQEAYAALNRNDIPAFIQLLDPQIEWIEPAEIPGGGTHRGLEAVKAHLSQARGTWAEGTCQPERVMVAGDRIILFVYVHVRLKHETDWREGRIADAYTFRNGKAIQKRTFTDTRQAIEWAGVQGADES
jgi:ketosteroid isomerase-like protein